MQNKRQLNQRYEARRKHPLNQKMIMALIEYRLL